MKKLFCISVLLFVFFFVRAGEWIRVNQLGYLPDSKKIAVFMSESPIDLDRFELKDAYNHSTILTFNSLKYAGR